MSQRITKGEALVGDLHADDDVIAVDLVQGADVTATDDVAVGDDLDVVGDTRTATLRVGAAGTVVKTVKYGTGSINFADCAAGETVSGTITVTGAAVGDAVIVNPPAMTTGLGFAGAAVTGANTVTVYAVNASANPINEGAATFEYVWIDLT